jgi:CubicO group peptidase (beta-lactamase class C family)
MQLVRSTSFTRMSGRLAALMIIVCTASPSIVSAQSPDLAALDKYVAHAARDWRIPGMAIAVVKDDSLVFAKGYGVIEIGKPAPATEHTRFAIGSTTKAMTVASLAMLVDEGKLKWDDRVIDYLPDFQLYDSYATRELTVRDLLTHRTGLPGTDLLWALPENQYPLPEMIRRLRYVKPSSSFRSQWEYQNVMYEVAGGLVAKISGMPWETFVRTRIFAPLGMNESIPLVSEAIGKPNVAVPHDDVHDTVRVVRVRTTDGVAAAGSVWSSVADMSKWMRFMLDSGRIGNKRLIEPATFREIVAPEIRAPESQYPALELAQPKLFTYALGWFVEEYNGETVWMHTGSIDGMSAIIGLLPSRRVGVYVLANLDHAELRHALMYKVFDLYHPPAKGPARDWSADLAKLFEAKHAAARTAAAAKQAPRKDAPASLPLEQYVGTYADSTYGNVEITLRDSSLYARYENFDIGGLVHTTYDSFRSRKDDPMEGGTELTFVPDGTGHVASLQAFGTTFVRTTTRSRTE